ISSLLQDISLKRIVLPEIQREYVWSEQKARDLVDSLYKKFPIGVILLWRQQSVSDFRLLEGQEDSTRDPDWYILDGQQRLTSLNQIKSGNVKVRFNIDDEIFSIENRANASDPKWLRVDEIWNKGTAAVAKVLSNSLDISIESVYEKYVDKIKKIEEIPNYKLPVFEERGDNYARIAEIYMRLNEKGTKLKKAEINLALVVLKFPRVFYDKLSGLVQEFEDWELDTNFFLRCFVSISTKQSKYEPLRKYLTNASQDEVLSNLEKVRESLKASFDFITSRFGISPDNNTKLIPSEIAIIPLMMYLAKTNGRVDTARELDILTLWFFAASHFGRYSGPTESLLNEDFKALGIDNTIDSWLNSIKRERVDLNVRELEGRINNTNLFALYFALRSNNAIDWWSGTSLNNTANIEFHHIFPKKVLKDFGYPDNQINDIRNIAIVSRKANRKISAMEPRKYFASEIGDMNRVYSQFVPQDEHYWKVENYLEFLAKREESIINKLNQTLKELDHK
ncbi:MAG: GmrSD restriction endonuclease domain-containing protein, partial [Nitrososphaeraceae archaeon]